MTGRPSHSRATPSVDHVLRDGWALTALERAGLLTREDADKLRAERPEWVATPVIARGHGSSDQVAAALARHTRSAVADLDRGDAGALHFLPEAAARRYFALPLSATDRVIRIATANPMDLDAEQAIAFATGRTVEFHYALPEVLRQRIEDVYRPERSIERLLTGLSGDAVLGGVEAEETDTVGLEAPAAKLVEATIADGVREGASDLHLEPTAAGLIIRYRVDGVLREVMRVPRAAAAAVTRRIKVSAGLDITDPLHPHDGRASAKVDGKVWDLRVSSVPIARMGEKIVIRLLDPHSQHLKLDTMGIAPEERRQLDALLQSREGILLVTGPTGSGKTSTLYAALEAIRTAGINVVTVEDPVEYRLQGVNQIEVNEKQGFSFAQALRSVLRQDPDIVLLGEIRDLETATTAWQAALSGHFVLSTLHTNDAASAVMRLRDIGIESFKISAALKGVVAQRLVRRLCPACKTEVARDTLPEPARPLASATAKLFKPVGCTKCSGTGYRGRFAIEEILTVTPDIAKLIADNATAPQITARGRQQGLTTLWESGLKRVWSGDTGYEELVRVVGGPTPTETPADEPPAAGKAAAPGPVVLLVDDEPSTRAIAAAALEGAGFRVAEAEDGVSGLEAAQRLHPALMLLDMDMPRMGGLEVLKELRGRLSGRGIPVIVVTSSDDAETESKCIELGAEDYIVKPIRPPSLLARVQAVLRRTAAS